MKVFSRLNPGIQSRVLLIAFILSANGCFDTTVSGTSTTTGNTISARALLSDGSPASGAKVAVRQSGFMPAEVPGRLANAFSKDTTTDSTGYFEMHVPAGMNFFLSVYAGHASDEAFWQAGVTGAIVPAKTANAKDTVVLKKAGGVSGYVLMDPADSLWVGFPGTSRFIRPQANGYFNLDSLPPGNHELRIVRLKSGALRSFDVHGWTSLSGATVKLDTLALPPDTAIHSLLVPACLDPVDSIIFASKPAGPSDPRRVFRTVMETSPPQWVELDACLGQWTSKATLPNSVTGNIELFAGPTGDYLMLPDSNRIWKLDSSGTHALPSFPESLALSYFHAQRFYGFFHLDSALRSFPDEAAWIGKRFNQSYPRPATFQRFAVGDSAIQYLVSEGSGMALVRYEFNTSSLHGTVPLPDFHDVSVGMAAGRGNEVWLLNDSGTLHRLDGISGRVHSKSRVIARDSMRGLAGGE